MKKDNKRVYFESKDEICTFLDASNIPRLKLVKLLKITEAALYSWITKKTIPLKQFQKVEEITRLSNHLWAEYQDDKMAHFKALTLAVEKSRLDTTSKIQFNIPQGIDLSQVPTEQLIGELVKRGITNFSLQTNN